MFAKITLALSTFVVLAAAIPTPDRTVVSQCNTGSAQCCNSVQDASSPHAAALLGLLGAAVGSITGQVGLGCTPISVIALDQAANCAQMPVCCEGNQFNGLVNVGCTPISL